MRTLCSIKLWARTFRSTQSSLEIRCKWALSIYLSIYLSNLSIYLSIYLSTYLSFHMCIVSKVNVFYLPLSLIYLSYLPMCINGYMLYTNFYGLYLNPYVSYIYIIKSMQTYAKCRSRIEKLISFQLGK